MTKRTWFRISESLRYFLVGAGAIVAASDVIPDNFIKWFMIGNALLVLALKAVDMGLGQAPREPKAKPTI